jgi:hypothetical protein
LGASGRSIRHFRRCAIGRALDHLVGAHKDCFGNGDPQGFRRLQVYDKLEPSWALNGEIGRFGAAQNPTDVAAATTKHIGQVWSVGNKTSGAHVRPVKVYRRQASFGREFSNPHSVSETERIRQNDESVRAPVLGRLESTV